MPEIKISSKNFKSFSDFNFSPQRLTILIGTNASGKSNMVDCFKFLDAIGNGRNLRSLMGGRDLAAPKIRGSLDQLFRKGTRNLEIVTTFRKKVFVPIVGATEERYSSLVYRIKLSRDKDNNIAISEIVEVKNQGRTHKYDARKTFSEFESLSSGNIPLHSYQFAISRIYDLMPSFIEEANRLAKLINSEPNDTRSISSHRDKISELSRLGIFLFSSIAILETLKEIEFLEPDPSQMRSYNSLGDDQITTYGGNISSALFKMYDDEETRASILSWISRISNCEFIDIDFDYDVDGNVIALLREQSGFMTPLSSASDGTLRFIAILAKLHQVKSGSTLFVEEIENGIHPTRVMYALQMINEISEARGVNCCVTTHSPISLIFSQQNDLLDKSFLVYRDDKRGVSGIHNIESINGITEALINNDLSDLFLTGWMEDSLYFSGRS